ncbi:MAG: hypothetical protein AAGL89_12400 [Pseudomonadota bacterium]
MAEKSSSDRDPILSGPGSASVDALASRALNLVAARNARLANQLDYAAAARLHDAAVGYSREDVASVIADMRANGIAADVIADLYIPHAARVMGDEWCEDRMSFARVTIGTARLQSALRGLGEHWSSYDADVDPNDARAVIVIVVKDSFHTLGAMVLCGQLRRLGLSVRLSLGASDGELRTIFKSTEFDAALISANESETLDSLRKVVELIRSTAASCPPIIVGGGILDLDIDVQSATGADFATKDPIEALKLCGLTKTIRKIAIPQQRRG